MEFQNIFQRYEMKYLMTKQQQHELYGLMLPYMQPDRFGRSTVLTIYYDMPDKRLIRKSLEGPCYKEKLRVRSYGTAKADSTVFVELKKKYKGVVYKRRLDMNERTAGDYLNNGMRLTNPTQISKEIDYFMRFYGKLEPSVFLSYEREAFAGKEDANFRMTFDRNILMRTYDMDLKKGVYGEPLLKEDMVLLEVKTAYGIPAWLLTFLNGRQIYKTSFSKYGYAYQKFMLPAYLKQEQLAETEINGADRERCPVRAKENGGTKDVA